MKLLMVFADGFEDTEAIATIDVLKRGNITVDAVSLMDTLSVKTKCGFCLVVDKLFKDINIAEYDGIIIPGGPGSFKLMPSMDNLTNVIHYFAKNNKLVASICAAPHLVGRLGYFKGLDFTVHPGFENQVIGGNYRSDLGVCKAKNFITAKSMYYSLEFGYAIYEYFNGDGSSKALREACQGN